LAPAANKSLQDKITVDYTAVLTGAGRVHGRDDRWEGLTSKTISSLADSLGRPELLAENFAYIAQILF